MYNIELVIVILDVFPKFIGSDKLLRMLKMLDKNFDVIDKQVNDIKTLLSML